MGTMEQAKKNVENWPEWKKQAGDAFMARLKENARIIRERMEYTRLHGEQ